MDTVLLTLQLIGSQEVRQDWAMTKATWLREDAVAAELVSSRFELGANFTKCVL